MAQTLKLYGPPGCGKTHRLLELFELELAAGVPPERVAFLTFTRSARAEALSRVKYSAEQLPYVRTIHSICYRQLGIAQGQIVKPKDLVQLGKQLGVPVTGNVKDPWSDDLGLWGQQTRADVLLQLNHLGRHRREQLKELLRYVNTELDLHFASWFTLAYKRWKVSESMLDYTDLLIQYLEHGTALDVDVIFIDEAQDLSKLQWAVVRKLGEKASRRYIAGDDDQCQPAGEIISTNDGDVPIEDLDQSEHRVVPYISGCGFYGLQPFNKAVRQYSGRMLTIKADGKSTRCTPEHKWLVRWLPVSGAKFVNYLMRRGNWFRLGQCILKRSDNRDGIYTNASELQVRCRIEKADAVWILKVNETRKEAIYYEASCVVRYGITDLCFESGDTENLHKFHEEHKPDKVMAVKCLTDHGRLMSCPLWTAEGHVKTGYNTSWKTAACNLMTGLMSVPRFTGEFSQRKVGIVAHHPLEVIEGNYTGEVYSLNVEKYHTYMVNGFATCNCIFHWAGASAAAFNAEPADEVEELTQSYRLPRRVHDKAQEIISNVRARVAKHTRPTTDAGVCLPLGYLDEGLLNGPGGVLCLFRNHHRGQLLGDELERLGVPYGGPGAPLAVEAVRRALEAWRSCCTEHEVRSSVLRGLLNYADVKVEPGLLRNERVEPQAVFGDRPELGKIFQVLTGLPHRDYLRRCVEKYGYGELFSPRIRLMSIHQSKGQEADTVILDVEMARKTFDAYWTEPDDEHRVWYVGVTRAKRALYHLLPSGPMAYPL